MSDEGLLSSFLNDGLCLDAYLSLIGGSVCVKGSRCEWCAKRGSMVFLVFCLCPRASKSANPVSLFLGVQIGVGKVNCCLFLSDFGGMMRGVCGVW